MAAIPFLREPRGARDTVRSGTLRTASFAIAVAWVLWQIESIAVWAMNPEVYFSGYTISTAVIFGIANAFLFAAIFAGSDKLLVLALRVVGLTLPLVILLLVFRPLGNSELWYAGFTGVPAVAFALTVSVRKGVTFFALTVGGASFVNALFAPRSLLIDVIATVGFSLINTFAFIIFASSTMTIAALIDRTEERSRLVGLSATRIRARTEEMEGFTALLHDHILSGLSAISKGLRPQNPIDGIEEMNTAADTPELSHELGSNDSSHSAVASPYRLMGMNIVFSWQFGLGIGVVLLLVMVISGRLPSYAGLSAYLILIALLPVLIVGNSSRLSSRRATVIAFGLIAVTVIGQWQTPPFTSSWAANWQVNAMALFASLLAIRGRPGWAAFTVLGSACGVDTIRLLGAGNDATMNALTVVAYSIIVVAAGLANLGFRYLLERQPIAVEDRRRAEADRVAAEEAAKQRTHKLQLLDNEVRPVFDAAQRLDPISSPLRGRARLTELWLRDLVRSPLLNIPAIRESVRAARMRGVTVQLLDDLSHTEGVDRTDIESAQQAIWALRGHIITDIDKSLPDTSVTVRVMPPGRRAFLVVTGDHGSRRFGHNGLEL